MPDCPFCAIDDIRTRTLEETKQVRVIFSNPRLVKGHLLVVPKRHIEQPWELTQIELQEVFSHIHRLQKKIAKTISTGCDVRQNYRPFLQQGRLKVDHVHFHLLPRTFEDDLYKECMKYEAGIFRDVTAEEIAAVRASLA